MAIKVLIKRRIPEGFIDPQFSSLIRKLRALAAVREGYAFSFKNVRKIRVFS